MAAVDCDGNELAVGDKVIITYNDELVRGLVTSVGKKRGTYLIPSMYSRGVSCPKVVFMTTNRKFDSVQYAADQKHFNSFTLDLHSVYDILYGIVKPLDNPVISNLVDTIIDYVQRGYTIRVFDSVKGEYCDVELSMTNEHLARCVFDSTVDTTTNDSFKVMKISSASKWG